MEDQLHQARAIAQVDEDQPAVIAAAVHPSGDTGSTAGARRGQLGGPGVAVAVWLAESASPSEPVSSQNRGDHRAGGQLLLVARCSCP